MASCDRRGDRRRTAPRRRGSRPSLGPAIAPSVQALEARRLLANLINEFGGSATLDSPSGITAGPDGNLWFTESSAPSGGIGRITPSGSIRRFGGLSPGASPAGITSGPNKALYFTEPGTGKIGRITTDGTVTEFSSGITPNSAPDSIATGLDQALWFTERSANKIGRLDPTSGGFSEFAIPTANSQPAGITAAFDGALWFAESNAGKVGRIDLQGNVTEFSAGLTPGGRPTGITTGIDGNLYLTEPQADKIARVSTAGAITEFSSGITPGGGPLGIVQGPQGVYFTERGNGKVGMLQGNGTIAEFSGSIASTSGPDGITFGPDGNYWLTELAGNHVDRFGAAGDVAIFPSGTNALSSGASPLDIAAGPDGALWFTEHLGDKIGRIDTAGRIAEFSQRITPGARPRGIAAGGDGNLWFTEEGLDQVARITPGGTVTEFTGLTSGSAPGSIARGADGNLYFTETGAGSGQGGIGMITTLGAIREFGVAEGITVGATPRSITRGPDNNLWFTEQTPVGARIGRLIPPSGPSPGQIAEFPIGIFPNGVRSDPQGITTGPDGFLWFADPGSQTIGHVSTTGFRGMTSFPLPAGTNPNQITLGPDGFVWFTAGTDRVGRIPASGAPVDLFPLPTPGATGGGITAGPDNNLWFTESSADQVGQVVLPSTGIASATPTNNTLVATTTNSFPVGTLVDNSTATNAANFTVTIDYGDGTTGTGVVYPLIGTPAGGVASVLPGRFGLQSGIHQYTAVQLYTLTITVSNPGGSFPSFQATVNSTNPITVTGRAVDGIAGRQANTNVATFSDLNPPAATTDFTASIDWGDGTTTPGVVDRDPGATSPPAFRVFGRHAYAAQPKATPRVTVTDVRNNLTASGTFTAAVAPAPDPTPINEIGGPTPGGGPTAITAGPDGSLWFIEANGARIGRIDTAGRVTEFPGPTSPPVLPSVTPSVVGVSGFVIAIPGANPGLAGITGGPDGALWFTERNYNAIGRITTAGKLTQFGSRITAGSGLAGIAGGPDGNLWFAERAGDRIGRITPAGVVTEFAAGLTSGGSPVAIAAGPDGNLWFTDEGAGRIGRITPAGVITEFSGVSGTGLTSITAGPDGALWFTERQSDAIGRIDPATGRITEFRGSGVRFPTAIAAGPDGNLWFTEDGDVAGNAGSAVGRITPQGAITQFSTGVTPNGVLDGIAAGPDGNLWFAETAGDRIGHVILPQASVQLTTISLVVSVGQPLDTFFGGFSDKSEAVVTANFRASIDFGDGQSAPGTVGGIPDTFNVRGGHTYASAGLFHGTLTVFNQAGRATSPFTVLVNVPGGTTIAATGIDSTPRPGEPARLSVARFTTSPPTGDLTASIDWGDGSTPTANALVGNGVIFGDHTYNRLGRFTITTTIRNASGPGLATATSTASVFPATALTPLPVIASVNSPFGGPVAFFFDKDGTPSSTYTVSIDWGDGSTTPGSLGTGAQAGTVLGGHTYATAGTFPIHLTVAAVDRPATFTLDEPAEVDAPGPIDEVGQGIAAPGNPSGIAAGPDGNLWFTSIGAIGRITPGGVITEFANPNRFSTGITAGPDGALWFGEQSGAVGRITTDGVITRFPVAGSVLSITAGPDGALWFAGGAGVGRITTSGAIATFPVSGGPAGSITAGPDGALWFTLNTGHAIGRITTSGAVSEFMLGAGSDPVAITSGPDGALWFTEILGKVGRITTSGAVTEFGQGLRPESRLTGIAAGPDGNLYFLDSGVNHVDRITPSGAITAFTIPTSNSRPVAIAFGPDFNMWFTESGVNQIGQLVMPQSVDSVGAAFNVAPGQAIAGTFATFRDRSSLVDLTRFFTPSIDFGDGTTGQGTLAPDGNGGFALTTTHTYAIAGTYSGSAAITDAVGTSAPAPIAVTVAIVPPPPPPPGLSFVVTSTLDSGPGSLRQAILNADLVGGHVITFAIPGTGSETRTIVLLSALPDITGPTALDGRSQALFDGSGSTIPRVEVDGRLVGGIAPGFRFDGNSAGSLIVGLSAFGFGGALVDIEVPNVIVRGDYLGLRADGSTPSAGGLQAAATRPPRTPWPILGADGVLIRAAGAVIGGLGPGDANVISSNPGQGIELSGPDAVLAGIFGNLIGLDPTGRQARGNGINGIAVLGGAGAVFIGPGDVISANGASGIALLATRSIFVDGDRIGTDASGTMPFGNKFDGILIDGASSYVTIGGATLGGSNLISGNAVVGVAIMGGSNHVLIQANLIGTDLPGVHAIGNGVAGVLISDSPSNVVGAGNLISGNGTASAGAGVWIDGPGSTGNLVAGNAIGTDLAGESPIPNAVIGVLINEAPGNTVGGAAFGAGNLISGNTLVGLEIAGRGSSANVVQGNRIGTDLSGARAIGNGSATRGIGLLISGAPGNFLGGSGLGVGNVISGNRSVGVEFFGPAADGNLFQGNFVGVDPTGTRALGNGDDGVVVDAAPRTRLVGNLIAANGRDGVTASGSGASGTRIQGNAIGSGVGGRRLGNRTFGILIINAAPEPLNSGNLDANNGSGPLRDTNIVPAPAASTPVLVRPRALSLFGSRPMAKLSSKGNARPRR